MTGVAVVPPLPIPIQPPVWNNGGGVALSAAATVVEPLLVHIRRFTDA